MHIRLLFIVITALLVAMGCGDDEESGSTASTSGIPESICPVETAGSDATAAGVFQVMDHDGGHSDLKMEWDVYQQQGYACSGKYDFTLTAKNVSQHSDAHRVWFTVIFYHGDEYIRDMSIYPQGITIPVGESQDFNFHLDIDEAFPSAPDGREITTTIIIQTDNPNWSDPDAFFTRTWIRLLPASDCDAEPMPQPDPHMLSIHSVTCKDATVKLQTHSSLLDGFPQSEVISGPILLNGGVYEEGGFYWQSTHIAGRIEDDNPAKVDMFSNEQDRIRFYFRERVDCDWVHTPIHPPGDDDGDDQGGDDGDGSGGDGDDDGGNGDDGSVIAPDPDDPDKPDDSTEPRPDRTVEEQFADVSACGAGLTGSVVPPAAGPVTGKTWKEVDPDGEVEFFFDVEHLPEASIGEGQQGWVQGVQSGQYVAWLVRQVDERFHMVPVKAFSSEAGGSTTQSVQLDQDGVVGLDGSLGKWVDTDGTITEATGMEPLASFRGFVITLQPASDLRWPNGMVLGGGWLTP